MDTKTGGEAHWTPREREVLERISRGLTNFEIAQDLGISLDGAKWHVSQILSKLGVTSREEAATYWKRRRWRRTAGRLTSLKLAPLALRVAVSVAALGGGTAIVAALILARQSSEGAAEEDASLGDQPTITGEQATLRVGEILPFTCLVATRARRPSADEMLSTYAIRRFQDENGVLYPPLFALELSSIYYDFAPTANSAAIEPSNFFRSVPMPSSQCRAPEVHNVRLRDYRPIEIEVTSVDPSAARLLVKPDPGMRYDLAFKPLTDPDPKGGNSPSPLSELSAELADGTVIRSFKLPRGEPEVEYRPDGSMVVGEIVGGTGAGIVKTNGLPGSWRILASGPGGGGSVAVRRADGTTIEQIKLVVPDHAWQQLAMVNLTQEATDVQVTSQGGLLIVPVDTPLPPDGQKYR
ncbi:MAG: helix-turn-helix transcriptional regulator [Dehalococcoidia bacterium]